MARIRNIKPEYFTDAELCELSPLHRLLFAALWCHADRDGRLEDKPRELKVKCLPYDECDANALLEGLARAGFIVRYQVNGRRFLAIPGFAEHQRFHKDEKSRGLPPPPEVSTVPAPPEHPVATVPEPAQERVSTVPNVLVSEICNLESVIGERKTEPPPAPRRSFIAQVPEKPTKPDEVWDGSDFKDWAQAKRFEEGFPPDVRVNERDLSAWFSSALMAGFSPRDLRLGFCEFGGDPYWLERKLPFKAWLSEWSKYVRKQQVAHAS